MKKLCTLTILLYLLGSSVFSYTVVVSPTVACRTKSNLGTPPGSGNNHDSSKLTVRAEDSATPDIYGQKSWIRFQGLKTIDPNVPRGGILKITVAVDNIYAETHFSVSAVNDSCLDNITWAETALTWLNAPGNDVASLGALDAAKTTLLSTITFPNAVIGQVFEIDVTPAILADTDGIVQFVLHNSNNNLNFATWDYSNTAYRPTLTLDYKPNGADHPNPAIGAKPTTSLSSLSWTLPDPNIPGTPIWCDVYLGTEPNRPQMVKKSLGNGVATIDINTAFGVLVDNTKYYWFVDCHDSSRNPNPVPGETWSFTTDNNVAPVITLDKVQILWGLPKTATLEATVTDDALPTPPVLTYLWEQTKGPVTAVINSPQTEDTTVSITERGDYQFRLTVSDGVKSTTAFQQVVVGLTPCDASHIDTGLAYDTADENLDCEVNLKDFAEMAFKWMHCSETLTNCGR